ncbi:hypothetical protein V1520DRAFT_225086 [Lipomyces starkeyi]|uniref:Transposase putative helix-turn-helix domain-containing protein n=1 Tax=Lipomyces starkeyi NRRL Y-11557 TaxID=675824 RepID=A0A1E3Q4R4_LIPST|nr:hypothetical protein LIPSTDRAFT_300582 [Lipomyces starkeyi NRRL Y-11557]
MGGGLRCQLSQVVFWEPFTSVPCDNRHRSKDGIEFASKANWSRLYPTAEETKILLKWIGAARWTYNECLHAIKVEGVPKSKKALRARAINNVEKEILKMGLDREDSLRYPCFQKSIVIHNKH